MEIELRRVDRRLAFWLLLLLLFQLTDVATTAIDMSHGTIEGNQIAAGLMASGGLPLLGLMKLALVAALGLGALLAQRCTWIHPELGYLSQKAIWRGLQVSALFLGLVTAHNLALLISILY